MLHNVLKIKTVPFLVLEQNKYYNFDTYIKIKNKKIFEHQINYIIYLC